ncbi:hypothetical protein PV409_37965 [Streptomyces sp. ME02-6979.5a]|uniref:hypothetical protein n=1 Tax=unclassified Streptomyces TaxID=2593676 RepID=UPI0029BCEC33|nr:MULTISPECIES: hypothetical protein [unclassified Streptomyces]MDX3343741.1 hypothetical protein [Streptomyces sp. ME02-6979.5a]MDX5526209.1 hypothetical protein [Streptomyces sp. DE06-01C]
MRTRTTLTAATAAALLALTGCSSDEPAAPASAQPSATTAKTYTYADCVDLLEYDYQQDQPQDASGDPECSHLTPGQYQQAVTDVLTAHKDEILRDAQ